MSHVNSKNIDESEEPKYELEEQFIIRLPEKEAQQIKKVLQKTPSKLKKSLKISLNSDDNKLRTGTVQWKKKVLNGNVYDLPCHIESLKTQDRKDFYKTADISKILICTDEAKPPENNLEKIECPHGITSPLKNVRKNRFRKTVLNEMQDVEKEDAEKVEVQKEVIRLLRMDNDAVASRFTLYYEEDPSPKPEFDEFFLFGELDDMDFDE